jgi:poly(A) polymerase
MAEHDSPRADAPPSLKEAEWLKRPETARVFAALSARGIETRAVGGAVRNALLGQEVTEVDLATTATPDKVMALARKAGLKAIPTGIEHGTVTVVANGAPFEVTTLRCDVETFGRHAKVVFTENWEEDARRRDFTLNALYARRDGTLFDPLGGYADLVNGRVRFIGEAAARIREDYLRILRFFRFNAYYGKGPLDQEGLLACVRLRRGLAQLSAERVWVEFKRILVAPKAYAAIEALFDYGLLTEILGGVPRLQRLGRLIVIETALGWAPSAPLRLTAGEDASRLAVRLKLSNAEQAVLALGADEAPEDDKLPDDGAAKRLLYALGPNRFAPRLLLAWAASGASPRDPVWRGAFTLPDRWQAPSFPLRGSDITNLSRVEGPAVGEILRRIETEWIESGFSLPREALLARAVELSRRSAKQVR